MAAQVAAKKDKAAPKPKAPYAFRRVDAYDGGVGTFAARDLKRGEVILHEAPLVVATMATLEKRVAALDDKARKRLFSLCDWRAERSKQPKTALGVFQANGYPCPAPGDADAAGVFLRFSRFNHSCKPNAHHAWRGGRAVGLCDARHFGGGGADDALRGPLPGFRGPEGGPARALWF